MHAHTHAHAHSPTHRHSQHAGTYNHLHTSSRASCSRNLLAPILIHGVWNSAVLSLLFLLVASGVQVDEILAELRG